MQPSAARISRPSHRQRQPDQSDQWCPRCQHHQFLGGGALTGVSHEDVQEGGVVLQLWSAKSVGLYNYVKTCHNNIMTRIWTKFSSKSYIICIEKCEILEVRQMKFLDTCMSNPGSANGLLPDNTASQQWVDITSGNDLSTDSTEPRVSYIIMSFGPIVPWQGTIDNMNMKWICIHHMDTLFINENLLPCQVLQELRNVTKITSLK